MNLDRKISAQVILEKLSKGGNLSRKEASSMFKEILDGKFGVLNDIYFGSFFGSMQTKGPTDEEVAGLMDVVLNHGRIKLRIKPDNFCGIVGSGRDQIKTINVSTAASIVASGLGVKVIKNGCRSESSVSGTTDVLEELGVNVSAPAKTMINCLSENNFGFFDAEPYFPVMFKQYVGKFPFINPLSYALSVASAVEFKNMIFGLSNPNTEFTAKILKNLGFQRALVVQGLNKNGKCFDEISILGKTKVSELKNGKIKNYFISPKDFDLPIGIEKEIIQHKSNKENSFHLLEILSGRSNESSRNIVALNAGAILYISGIEKNFKVAVKKSLSYINSGECKEHFRNIIIDSGGDLKKYEKYLKKIK